MISVLVVDDSPVMQDVLRDILQADPELGVVDVVSNGAQARESMAKRKPDVAVATSLLSGTASNDAKISIAEGDECRWVLIGHRWMKPETRPAAADDANEPFCTLDNPLGLGPVAFKAFASDLCETVRAAARGHRSSPKRQESSHQQLSREQQP